MFGFGNLNQDSLARIQNIVNGFRNYPAYSAYQIKSYLYDMRAGCHAIEISRNGQVINLFLFYPQYGGSGKIGSIALYGANLQGHYNAMRSSMTAFGMPISDIQFDSGIETFLDITLDY
jgi:hypothetical protein